MALSNAEVLENLKKQLVEVNTQYEQLATTRLKILGAIDVLEQIETGGEKTETVEPEVEPEVEEKE